MKVSLRNHICLFCICLQDDSVTASVAVSIHTCLFIRWVCYGNDTGLFWEIRVSFGGYGSLLGIKSVCNGNDMRLSCDMCLSNVMRLSHDMPLSCLMIVALQSLFSHDMRLSCADATKLMKREGIRSVPAFHFWKKGAKVEVFNSVRVHVFICVCVGG